MPSFDDSPQKGQLCEVCSTIDFKSIAHPTRLCTKTHQNEPYESRILLGTASDICERSDRCVFCNLVWRRLRSSYGSDANLDGRCDLYNKDLCISAFPGCGDGDIPDLQNLQRGLHAHIRMATVQFSPEEYFIGPVLPWQRGGFSEQGVREIVHLQVALRTLSQSTQPDESDAEENSVEDILKSVRVRRAAPEVDVSLLSSWLRRCESIHRDNCSQIPSTRHEHARVMPAFVIDVKSCCVVETPSDCRYVALSYVWGTAKTLKHVKDNSDALQVQGSLSTLEVPGTIRDSMRLVHGIGERYLWVDALCIVQDDIRMQQTQISQMHEIYTGALLTIIAAFGNNADSGLPGVYPNNRAQAQQLISLPECDLAIILSDNETDDGGSKIARSMWIQRAWTMQELFFFSRRCLIFTDNHVYWRCRAAIWLEGISLEHLPVTDLGILPANANFQLPTQPLRPQEYFNLYERLVSHYGRRRLSYSSDLINAFSGFTSALSTLQKDSFFWGHPCTQFSRSLGWSFKLYHTRNHARTNIALRDGSVREIPFPSWSWAAWEGKTQLPWISFRDYPAYRLSSQVISEVFEPITKFWLSNEYDELVRIEEHGSGVPQSEEDHAQQLLWQGAERENQPNGLEHQDRQRREPGRLYFWSSVATFSCRDVCCEIPKVASLCEHDQSPFLVCACRRAERDATIRRGLYPHKIIQDKVMESKIVENKVMDGYRNYDLVVVGRVTRSGGSPKLLVIPVEWKNGVAYRLGSNLVEPDLVAEEQWIALKHREWKFVTLG